MFHIPICVKFMIIVEYVLGLNHIVKGIQIVEHLCRFDVPKLSLFRFK
jgi:hypothetical protein